MANTGQRIVIGVDGGGTKTHGVLYREDGTVLAEGHFPSSNPHSNPEDAVRGALHGLIDSLLKEGAVGLSSLGGICLGMAGCDRPADKAFIEKIVRERLGQEKPVVIVNDAIVAIVAVLKKLHGILVISGTGSICFGFNEAKGENARCGGWGHILADEGSGYKIGLQGLIKILHAHDGRGPATSLTEKILGGLHLNNPTDLIGWTYMGGNGKTEIAALARYVHEEAKSGDAVAAQILDDQAAELVSIVTPVYRRLFDGEKAELALWGGNLIHVEPYRRRFLSQLEKCGLNIEPIIRDEQAVIGAAQHMLNNLG